MELDFKTQELNFYTEIRKDPLVKELGAEIRIRDLVGQLVMYQSQANNASSEIEKKLGFNLFSILNVKKPNLYFEDVKSIAYTVGTHRDDRNFLERIWTPENPLEKLVEEHEIAYENFRDSEDIKLEYFDEETVKHINLATDKTKEKKLRSKSLLKVFKKMKEHDKRRYSLMRFSVLEDSIRNQYNLDNFKKYGEINVREEKRLSPKCIESIQEALLHQAKINGLLSKTLYLGMLRLTGEENPVETTEELYGVKNGK